MAFGAASLKKTSLYCNIIILLGVEEHPNNSNIFRKFKPHIVILWIWFYVDVMMLCSVVRFSCLLHCFVIS